MTKTVLLGDETELSYGKGLPQRSRIAGSFPVYGSNGQVDTHSESLVKGPGIIVGRKGSVGEVIWSEDDFWPIDTTYYVKLKNTDDSLKYWYYQLKVLGLEKLNSHSAIPGLNRDVAYARPVIKRHPEEQNEIANILGTLDEKIDLNRKMNETLEQIGQALFRHYFIDNPEAGLWEAGDISKFADNVRENAKPPFTSCLRYVALEHFTSKTLALYDSVSADRATSNKTRFKKYDILFGKLRPYFHKVAIAPLDGVCSTDILAVRPKKIAYFAYVSFFMSQNALIEYVTQASEGTRMPRTSWSNICKYSLAIPPENLIIDFGEQMAPLLSRILANAAEIQNLTALRDTLLPRLISGKVKV